MRRRRQVHLLPASLAYADDCSEDRWKFNDTSQIGNACSTRSTAPLELKAEPIGFPDGTEINLAKVTERKE